MTFQNKRDNRSFALLLLMLGALAIAFAPVLAKLSVDLDGGVNRGGLGPVGAAFWRMVLAIPFFGLLFLRQIPDTERKELKHKGLMGLLPAFIPGCLFAMDLGLWHWSFEFIEVATSTLLANMNSVLVSLAGWLWLREKYNWKFWSGLAFALPALALLLGAAPEFSRKTLIGDVLGLGTALSYAGYIIALKILLKRFPASLILFASCISASLCLFVAALVSPGALLPATSQAWLSLIALSLIAQVLGQGLITLGLRTLPAGFSSVVLLFQPLNVAWLGYIILDQKLTPGQMLGGCFVLLGIFLANSGTEPAPTTTNSEAINKS